MPQVPAAKDFFALTRSGMAPVDAISHCFCGTAVWIPEGAEVPGSLARFEAASAREAFRKSAGITTYCLKLSTGMLQVETPLPFDWEHFDWVAAAFETALQTDDLPLAGVTIFAVDDCELNRMAISSVLGSAGAHIELSDSPIGIPIRTLEQADILIVDLHMQGISGLEFVQQLPLSVTAKRVLLTGVSVSKLARMPEIDVCFDLIMSKGAGWDKLRDGVQMLVLGNQAGKAINTLVESELLLDHNCVLKHPDAHFLLERFLERSDDLASNLRAAFESADTDATFTGLHQIVSVAANIHANRLFLFAKRLHDSFDTITQTDIHALVDIMRYTALEIRTFLAQKEQRRPLQNIKELSDLISKRSVKALILARGMAATSAHPLLDEVCDFVSRGKFDDASIIVARIRAELGGSNAKRVSWE